MFQKNDVLAICGDSITQQGIYSAFIEEYILLCQPTSGIKVMQCGWGGTGVDHFAEHMKDTALAFSPTVVTLCYGMNDGEYNNTNEVIEKRYRDGLTRAIGNLKAHGVRVIIVGSPGAVDAFYFHNPKHKDVTAQDYNRTLGRLGEIGQEVAKSEGVLFADLHTPMMAAMTKAKGARGEKYAVFGEMDGVHATPNGHLVMAYAFLKAMGFDGSIGTITYDDGSGKTEATEGQKVISSKKGEFTIESSRYPFCFVRGNTHPAGPTASILPFLPFNEELNRYILVVKNFKSPKARITWGSESKEFAAADLAKGINLAAEFLKNPFQELYTNAGSAVTDKHAFQIMFIKDYLGDRVPALMKALPSKESALKSVNAGFREMNDGMIENCVNAVKPVVHTVKVEAIN